MTQSTVSAPGDSAVEAVRRDQDAIARILIATGAVTPSTEEKFRFGSGLPSPIYIDNRRVLSLVHERRKVNDALLRRVTLDLTDGDFNVVVGVPTGGLPWAAWLADALDLPLAYVRPEAKDRGLRKQIEGLLPVEPCALVIDDLVTTGQSSKVAIDALRNAGARVPAVASIFAYGNLYARRLFSSLGIRHTAVTDLDAILRVGAEIFTPEEWSTVASWREVKLLPFEPKVA